MTAEPLVTRFREIRKVLWIVLLLNAGVASAKLYYGWITDSASIMADGYHSFSDGASNLVGILGIWLASKPRDEGHPYGHGKYETLGAVGIAVLLFFACIRILSQGVGRFIHPVQPQIDAISFVVMGGTLLVNIAVMTYEYRKGKRLHSDILISDSLHTGTDIFTTTSVMIGLIAVRAGYTRIDPVVAILVSVFIGFAAVEILRSSSQVLVDAVAVDKERIRQIAHTVKGIQHCHKIRSRGRSGEIHIDMHCHVDSDIPLAHAHEIAHEVEDKIKAQFAGIKDVTIHVEPD